MKVKDFLSHRSRQYYLEAVPRIIVMDATAGAANDPIHPAHKKSKGAGAQRVSTVQESTEDGSAEEQSEYEAPWLTALAAQRPPECTAVYRDTSGEVGSDDEPLQGLPECGPVYSPDIWPMLQAEMRQVRAVILVIWYTLDMVVVEAMSNLMRHGASAFVILDKGQCFNPSCSTHIKAIARMIEWGAWIRFKSQGTCHEKSWLMDDRFMAIGSANASGNSMLKCSEAVFVSWKKEHIDQHSIHFEKMWNQSQPVDLEALQLREAGRGQPSNRASAMQICNRRAPAREKAEQMKQLQGGRIPPPSAESDVRARDLAIMASPDRQQ